MINVENLVRACVGGTVVGALLLASALPARASDFRTGLQGQVIDAFLERVDEAAEGGDSRAIENRQKFDALSEQDKLNFASLLADGSAERAILGHEAHPAVEVTDESQPSMAPMAMNGWTRRKEACTDGHILGITTIRLCTGGDYRTSVGFVQETANPYSYIAFDYNPIISMNKVSDHSWSDGYFANFESNWSAVRNVGVEYSIGVRHTVRVHAASDLVIVNDRIDG